MTFENVYRDPIPGIKYICPCCAHSTLDDRGGYDICQICHWEDDGQDDHDADLVRGGPNKDLSLTTARENYKKIGAWHESSIGHVRPPTEEEKKTK